MSKGSNIRPRQVPKETWEDNWVRIFERGKLIKDMASSPRGTRDKKDDKDGTAK